MFGHIRPPYLMTASSGTPIGGCPKPNWCTLDETPTELIVNHARQMEPESIGGRTLPSTGG